MNLLMERSLHLSSSFLSVSSLMLFQSFKCSHFSRTPAHVLRTHLCPSFKRRATGDVPAVGRQNQSSRLLTDRSLLESSVVPAPLQELTYASPIRQTSPLAHEIIQGALVRHCDVKSIQPPTIVMVHGILGSKRNLHSFSKRLLEGFPAWQVILVDLPCHGESYQGHRTDHLPGSHDVNSAARDILRLLHDLKLFPRVLVGHSFGGKVVMSMAHQFGKTLPRPVQAWVLDTLPGEVSLEEGSARQDHPFDLIKTLQAITLPVLSRTSLVQHLLSKGFSPSVAHWMTTNLTATSSEGFTWSFDLNGIEQLYKSYETVSLWPLLQTPPVGLTIDFIRAERSHFKWSDQLQSDIESLGHRVHLLRDAGHWVHTDNPEGLYQILHQFLGSAPAATAL